MRPSQNTNRLDRALRHTLPVLSLLVTLTIDMLPWPWAPAASPGLSLTLMATYYWILYRPDLFTPTTIFVLGLLVDAALGLPFGLSALGYLLLYTALMRFRPMIANHPFFVQWAGFALTALALNLFEWLALTVLAWEFQRFGPALIHVIFAAAIFPVVAAALIFLHHQVGLADER